MLDWIGLLLLCRAKETLHAAMDRYSVQSNWLPTITDIARYGHTMTSMAFPICYGPKSGFAIHVIGEYYITCYLHMEIGSDTGLA
jgi:hypothetical protein